MFRLFNVVVLFVVIICAPLYLNGQHVWTLQECVDHALKNSINVKQSEISVKQAKISLTQKKLQMAPSLNGSVSNNYNYGRSVDPFSYTFTTSEIQSANFSLSSNVTLFNGFQLQNEFKQSQLDYESGKYDLEKSKNDIGLSVTSAFLQVLYTKDQLTAAKNRYEQSEKEQRRTKALTDAGSYTQGNLLDADAQLANDELAEINAENQYVIAKLSLAQLLELNESDSLEVAAPLTDVPDIAILALSPQEIFRQAKEVLPELKSSSYKVMSAEKGLAIARGSRSPRLSAFGSLGSGFSSQTKRATKDGSRLVGFFPNGSVTSAGDTVLSPVFTTALENTPYNDQANQNYNKSFGFSLSVPLFNGWSAEGNISRAKLNKDNVKLADDLTNKQVYKSIQQAYADAIGAQKKYAAAQKSKDALKSSYSYTEKKYNAGLLSSLDFLTVKNNLAKVESDFLQAKYDYIFRVKVLDFYAGKPLTL